MVPRIMILIPYINSCCIFIHVFLPDDQRIFSEIFFILTDEMTARKFAHVKNDRNAMRKIVFCALLFDVIYLFLFIFNSWWSLNSNRALFEYFAFYKSKILNWFIKLFFIECVIARCFLTLFHFSSISSTNKKSKICILKS